MLDDFLVRAALAGVGVSLAAAPLGCFIVWRHIAGSNHGRLSLVGPVVIDPEPGSGAGQRYFTTQGTTGAYHRVSHCRRSGD